MAVRIQRETRKGRPKGYGFRTRSEGRRLRRINGARHAHKAIRASGRVPGEEARAAVMRNREVCRRDREEGKGRRIGYTEASQYVYEE